MDPSPDPRSGRRLSAVASVACVLVLVVAATSVAYPPTPPSAAEARSMLAALTVAAENSGAGYDRDLFPHWVAQSGNCNTREVVLQRDGSGVTVDGSCQPVSGSWYSVYDAVWVYDSSSVDIDHIVALSEAWRSGGQCVEYLAAPEFRQRPHPRPADRGFAVEQRVQG